MTNFLNFSTIIQLKLITYINQKYSENRQFRYEERDPEGRVKGHFGYYDRDGKLQVFNYEADPEHGYHLEKASEH